MVTWIVRVTGAFEEWLFSVAPEVQDAVVAAMEVLEEYGPTLPLGSSTDRDDGQARTFVLLGGQITLHFEYRAADDVVILTYGSLGDAAKLGHLLFVHGFGLLPADWTSADEPGTH